MVARTIGGDVVERKHPSTAPLWMLNILDANGRQSLGAAIGEGIQDTVVHDAEDNRGSADAQREGHNGNCRKAAVLLQLPHRECKVLPSTLHASTSHAAAGT